MTKNEIQTQDEVAEEKIKKEMQIDAETRLIDNCDDVAREVLEVALNSKNCSPFTDCSPDTEKLAIAIEKAILSGVQATQRNSLLVWKY